MDLDFIERAADDPARLAVIWLHGLGADGHDFEPVADELGLGAVRFVFPHAPIRPVTINGGMAMRAWFDILEFGAEAPQDERGIRASAAAVRRLVDREVELGLPSERIVLAGFSQGGALALHTALREERALAGVLALSAFLPLAWTLAGEKSSANADIPTLMAHGAVDPVIPIEMAALGRRKLEEEGYAVEWREYPMAHTVCFDEIRDIGRWLARLADSADRRASA